MMSYGMVRWYIEGSWLLLGIVFFVFLFFNWFRVLKILGIIKKYIIVEWLFLVKCLILMFRK